MRRAGLLGIGAAAAWGLLVACGGDGEPSSAAPAPRAALVLEPPRLGVGQVATVELVVVTPPDHAARPFEPPAQIPGFWLLETGVPAVEQLPGRWLHRTRLRIRAREVGTFAWPEGSVQVEAPDGSVTDLAVGPLPIEVVSVRSEFPDRVQPFGVRTLPESAPSLHTLVSAAAGALLVLAAVGLVSLARRRGSTSAPAAASTPPGVAPWVTAHTGLAAARSRAASEPVPAAHAAAGVLRRYMARRYRADTEARTLEELERATPPFAATSRWPAFVSVLRELDALRFRPRGGAPADLARRVDALIGEIAALVDETTPPEFRRG